MPSRIHFNRTAADAYPDQVIRKISVIKLVRQKRRSAGMSINRNGDPAVLAFLDFIADNEIDRGWLEARSGVSARSFINMAHGHAPSINSLRAALNSVGLDLELVRFGKIEWVNK